MEADMRRNLYASSNPAVQLTIKPNRKPYVKGCKRPFEIVELAPRTRRSIHITVTLIGAIIVLLTIQWKLALVVFVMIPVIVAFTAYRRRKMSNASKKVKQRTAEINSDIESSISGIRTAKAYNNQQYELMI